MTKTTQLYRNAFACAVLLLGAPSAHGAWWAMQTSNFQDRPLLQTTIQTYAANDVSVTEIATTPNGEWVVVAGNQVVASSGFSALCKSKIQQYIAAGRTIDVVAFAPNGSWVVIAEDLHWRSSGLPQAATLADKIEERLNAGKRITEVAFTDNGFTMYSEGWAHSVGVPTALYNAIVDRHDSKRRIEGVTIADDGRWVLWGNQWAVSHDVNSTMRTYLTNWPVQQKAFTEIAFGPDGNFVMYSNGTYAPDLSKAIDRIEYGLQGGAKNIFERMQDVNAPGLTLAVIDNNQVVYARAYGEIEAGSQRFALATTPFDTASLSKYAAALGIQRLIATNQFNMTLATTAKTVAANATQNNALYAWKLLMESNSNAYGWPNAVDLPNGLTLERLLSHTASMEPWGSTGFRVSDWNANAAGLTTLLLGWNCDNNPCNYGNGHTVWYNPALGVPGTGYRYSGGGFLVAQAIAEERTQQSFETSMQQRVFTPLGLTEAVYVTAPPSNSLEAKLAVQHNGSGTPRERAVYPWATAGGLYSSASDYAKMMIPLLDEGRDKDGNQFLSPFFINQMLTDVVPGDGTNYGLGLSLSRSQVTENGGRFSHNGSHGSRAYAWMEGRPDLNQGLVVIVNAESDAVQTLVSEIVTAYRCAYGQTTTGCL